MTSMTELDRPIPAPHARRWPLVLAVVAGAAALALAAAAEYVLTHDGNKPLPSGVHTVQVYTVDDAGGTVAGSVIH
ncbi:hypothetical protein [Actinoplanes subtropicus]|uniref:hypothetical protein n=1 Tax=Actinoplanes subtropicus TaxID=543632 RepID=UPI0012F9F955|nr:hypothetical protein [Actinoplanes subtropicus]